MWRRLTGVRGLVGLRRVLFVAALLSLAATFTAILLTSGVGQTWDGIAVIALTVLAVRWWRQFVTERLSRPLDVVEVAAIGMLGIAIGADNAMPVVLAGLTFRSQYGSRKCVLQGALMYAAVQVAAAEIAHARFPDYSVLVALTQVPLLLMVPGAAAELARGLRALEAGAKRERALAAAAASFLSASGLKSLAARTEEAIEGVLGKRLAAQAVILDPSGLGDERTRFGRGGIESPVAKFGAIFVLPWQGLHLSERRWLATLADQLALAMMTQQLRAGAATERIHRLVENTGGVAMLVEDDLSVRTATPGTHELLGLGPEALVGTSVLDLVHRADRERAREALEAGVEGADCAPERVSVRLHGQGAARWAELALADLRDDELVGGLVVQLRDITARVALEEDVRRRRHHDPLTGLPNRESFERMVDDELRAGNDRLAVVLLDLDNFRAVNETLGHAAGDHVLTDVARRLASAVAGFGSVARLAGDDFAILIPCFEGGGPGADRVGRLLHALDRPFDAASGTLRLTAGAGVARVDAYTRSPKALLAAADAALDAAHADGPGSWALFAPKHHTGRLERAQLQGELSEAIGAGQLELDYQPLVDSATGAWKAAEALVRWRHPELGRLSPDRFIPLAEQSELIVAVGEWVLGEACRQLAEWRSQGTVADDFSVTVNVSGIQVARDDLSEHVQAALTASGLPPAALTLEITETAMVHVEGVQARLEALRGLGVRIAIDDFGTGHSSLAYLKDLPADIVKLPRPFVRDADVSDRGKAIIFGLVGLARPLGLRVVAEGVETRGQRDCVVAAGCELIQGYLYAAPMRPDQFAGLARAADQPGADAPGDRAGKAGAATRT